MGIITEFGKYVQSHKSFRVALLSAGFVLASVSLYMGFAAYLFIQYAVPMVAVLFILTLSIDVAIARLFQRNPQRSFWLSLVLGSIAIGAGAIIVSMGVLRGHWAATVQELLKESFAN
ncbi:MAG: hypothetical protein WBE45_12890 [Terriglobales bacterium]|jgi:hypothetical protein